MSIYKGDTGLEITIQMGQDISASSDYTIKVLKGYEEEAVWTPTIGDDDTSYVYITQSDDLNVCGTYTLQVIMTLGDWTGASTKTTFEVLPRI